MSVEALTSYVLEEVALDGEYGTTIPKLFQYVAEFYKQHRQRRFRIARLCDFSTSDKEGQSSTLDDDSDYFSTQTLDTGLRKKIWSCLLGEKDFLVGKKNEGRDVEFEAIEDAYNKTTETPPEKNSGPTPQDDQENTVMADNNTIQQNDTSESVEIRPKKPVKWKVYTSVERRWRALAGHGIDHKKIPPKFFDLLTEIGRHREAGILQPTLTKITNQDARSVGPRTAALAKMGYVEKVNVLAAKLRTSKLTLQSYATRRDLRANQIKKTAAQTGKVEKDKSANAAWTGDTVDVRKMVEAIFEELRKAKNQVLMHSDLKRKLGMDKSRFHFRAFARIIRRVEKTGCLRRIRVPLKLTRHKKAKSDEPADYTDKCLARCIKLIREPTEWDWEQTLNVIMKRTVDDEGDGPGDDDEEADKDADKDDEVVDDDAVAGLANAGEELVEEASRLLPKWTADRSLENIIYDVVDASGVDGISSMDLHQAVAGRFYYRPLDQVLRRLGDDPLKSQPAHLLRLAIIRETDIEGRHTHYRYFSYRWHERLVEAGLGKPMGGFKKSHSKGKKKEEKPVAVPQKRATVSTDDLGFSFVDKRRLLKSDGSGTLKEAQEKLPVPESESVLKSRYKIVTTDDGKSSVEWVNSWGTKTRAPNKKRKKPEDDDGNKSTIAISTPKRRGRPPKDPSGIAAPRRKKAVQLPANSATTDTAVDPPTNSDKTLPEISNTPATPSTAGKGRKRALSEVTPAQVADEGMEDTPKSARAKKAKTTKGTDTTPKPRGRPRKAESQLKTPRRKSTRVTTETATASPPSKVALDVGEMTILPLQPVRRGSSTLVERAPTEGPEEVESTPSMDNTSATKDSQPEGGNSARVQDSTDAVSISTSDAGTSIKRRGSSISGTQTPLPETPAPKRRGRPPKNPQAPTPVQTPRETRSRKKAAEGTPSQKITSFFKTRSATQTQVTINSPVTPSKTASNTASGSSSGNDEAENLASLTITVAKAKTKAPVVDNPLISRKEPNPVIAIDTPEIEMKDAPVNSEHAEAPPEPVDVDMVDSTASNLNRPKTPDALPEASTPQQALPPTPRRRTRRSGFFSASVDAVAEEIPATSISIPEERVSETIESQKVEEPVESTNEAIPATPNTKLNKGRMYKTKPASQFRQPRTEPTMELEEVDDSAKLSYGSAGGMLMIARQRVILELMEENGGVFPGGLEIKHAFECRYKKKNPKAGQPDRRLMVSLVSSLQRSGKINQIVINFINSRGLRQTKRILADSKLPLDSPLIHEMKNNLVAADGNLWFPEGTEIPKEAQKLASVVRGLPTQPGAIEKVEFERMYMPSRQLMKEQRATDARDNRLARIAREIEFPRFTAEQKEIAAKRLERRRRKESAMSRLQIVDDEAWDAMSDVEDRPPSYWWRNFVERQEYMGSAPGFVPAPQRSGELLLYPAEGIPEPEKAVDFHKGVRDVYSWEKRQIWADDELHAFMGYNMVNHCAPGVKTEGEDFHQDTVRMDDLICYDPKRQKGTTAFILKTPKRAGPKPRAAQKALGIGGGYVEEGEGGEMMFAKKKKRKPRMIGPSKQKPSRRDKAMAELHRDASAALDLEEESALEKVPTRGVIVPRKRHLFDHDQDDVLLAAIVIVRTLFGGFDRRIDWNLVRTAFPNHDLNTLKARWPRVRDAHRTHLKKLQVDFEEVYLDAYEKGLMPPLDRGVTAGFDLPWHTKWFRDNVNVPDAKSVPDLTKDRKVFDSIYDLRAEKPTWKDEFHNPALTGENRKNYISSHAYEISLFETQADKRPNEDQKELECIKSLIKANILTDISVYDATRAFSLLSSYPVESVDKAFYFLTGNKMLAPKKDSEKLVPGRNYEFTERFHIALRVQVGGRMWTQAVAFEKLVRQAFESPDEPEQGGADSSNAPSSSLFLRSQRKVPDPPPTLELSPFMNDGSVMALLDMVAHRRVVLDKSRYVSNIHGLITGYRTRGMGKERIDFPISASPTPKYYERLTLPPPPPPPIPNSYDYRKEPVKLWYDISGVLVQGMWRKCVSAVLGTIVIRPGVRVQEIVRVVWPGLTVGEVEGIVGWLCGCGVVEAKLVGEVRMVEDLVDGGGGASGKEVGKVLSEPVWGLWPREGYFWCLGAT